MPLKTFLLIPANNAGATIEQVFERIPIQARQRISRYIVVNDGSIDGTEAVLDRLYEDQPEIVRLRHTTSHGYGAACKTLLSCALRLGVEAAVILDADGRYPPESLIQLLNSMDKGGADIIQASRISDSNDAKNRFAATELWAYKTLTSLENAVFKMNLNEFHSGYRIYSRKALELIPFQELSDTAGFKLEMLLLARIKGLPIREVPIPGTLLEGIAPLEPLRNGTVALQVFLSYIRHRLPGQLNP